MKYFRDGQPPAGRRRNRPVPRELGAIVSSLSGSGRRWLAVVPGTWQPPVPAFSLSLTDLGAVPVTVSPFQPASGRSPAVQVDWLAAQLEDAFSPAEPVRAVLRPALRRLYLGLGWDLLAERTGHGLGGPPLVPGMDGLIQAAAATAADFGFTGADRAVIRAFFDGTLRALWTGPAGRFLEGGHPADLGSLLDRDVVVCLGQVPPPEAAFLAGTLLGRLADWRRSAPAGHGPDLVLALPEPRIRRVLGDLRGSGTEVFLGRRPAPASPGRRGAAAATVPAATTVSVASVVPAMPAMPGGTGGPLAGTGTEPALVPLAGRRSPACGPRCWDQPCTGRDLHRAGAAARSEQFAWFRLWSEALLLSFLTGNAMPSVPRQLRSCGDGLPVRIGECLLATVLDEAIASRATALRESFDPRRLAGTVAGIGRAALREAAWPRPGPGGDGPGGDGPGGDGPGGDGPGGGERGRGERGRGEPARGEPVPARAGRIWVIPQLRWLHEVGRLCPSGQQPPDPDALAPPLDYQLSGLADWPGIRVADRLASLRGHPLSVERDRNRWLAAVALHGERHDRARRADLAVAGAGLARPERPRHVARQLGAGGPGDQPGWLEVVLAWPASLLKRPDAVRCPVPLTGSLVPGTGRATAGSVTASVPRQRAGAATG